MALETHCCVFTRGEFFIRNSAGLCAGGVSDFTCNQGGLFTKLGNISSGLIEIQGSVLGRENEFNPALPESRLEILGVNLSLSLTCASKENLTRSLLSVANESDSGNYVEDFCLSGPLNDEVFLPFKHKGASSVTVYLRKGMDPVSTLSEGSDYLVSRSGVQFIRNDIDLFDADTVRISYSYDNSGYHEMSFLSDSPKYKEIYFKGINYGGEQSSLFDARFYRVLFAPVNGFDLITRDEFLTLNLIGKVEMMDRKWFDITKQE